MGSDAGNGVISGLSVSAELKILRFTGKGFSVD